MPPASRAPVILVAGASGLVGGAAVEILLASPFFDSTTIATRRHLPLDHARLRQEVVQDFEKLPFHPPRSATTALCAVGTTRKQAGSDQAFRDVDHGAAVAFAKWARASGVSTFVLISSAGANADSRNLYLRTKGEAENDIANLGFHRFVALRPGVLLGKRDTARPGESVAQWLLPLVGPLLVGGMRRYRAISAQMVAAAAVAAAEGKAPGRFAWENDAISTHGAPIYATHAAAAARA